ncbi:universal stress protein [Methanonatronarchaeum sp. AMET-Sl]|uniref:universal stress protein n=1 Tax=Methanonatronarchaeum sp. AMET-Sl TaxID=3037654 RepID=UPI00244DB615|nr:universal stress protein [Methanonatronarchaeum sp. AMET-Sl]WGI16849.1 universal stress protein [Methanonatronarchaeum sp. AMET-Sl]
MCIISDNDVFRVVVAVRNPETEFCLLKIASAIACSEGRGELVVVNVVEVPPQISLSQSIDAGSKGLEIQKSILDQAEKLIKELGVSSELAIRTRAIVGRDVGRSILRVLDEEDADHLVVGWDGEVSKKEYVLGSKIDPVVRGAFCEVTVVKDGDSPNSSIACLVGEGTNTPFTVKRGKQIRDQLDGDLTLINFQEIDGGMSSDEVYGVKRTGRKLIKRMSEEGGLEESFEISVIVGSDRTKRLLEEIEGYDFICVGAIRPSKTNLNTLFGPLPEKIGSHSNGTVLMVMGPQEKSNGFFAKIFNRIKP